MNLLDALIEDQFLLPPVLAGSEQRREVWICIRTDGATGDGSKENPYNGSTAGLFDDLMSSDRITTNMTIRLGPGIFQTTGGDGNGFGGAWRPQSGQRIVGSGMHATTLQMIDAGTKQGSQSKGQGIVSSNFAVNNFEIFDLTLDCNFARQINPFGNPSFNNTMVQAVAITGRNNRVRRVRAINFGTGPTLECFPIFISSDGNSIARGNPIVEDVVIELPNDNNGRETTCLSVYGDPVSTSPGAGGVLRNCYVNCELANPQYPEHKVVAVSVSGADIFITTEWPHCLQTRDIIYVTGSMLTGLVRFTLDGSTNTIVDYRTIKLRSGDIGANGTVRLIGVRRKDPDETNQLFLPSLDIESLTRAGTTATLTTATPHQRELGDWIRVSGVVVGTDRFSVYNGSYQVASVSTDKKSLTYIMPSDPGGSGSGEMMLDRRS